jgi:lysophospholipase L1-like esterase
LTRDGVHLTRAGGEALAQWLAPYLRAELTAPD